MEKYLSFIKIIESNLEQLLELNCTPQADFSVIDSLYLDIMIDYLRGELKLEKVNSLLELNNPKFFEILVNARHQILIDKIQKHTINELSTYLDADGLDDRNIHWRGEISFVLGLCFLELKSYEVSKFYFRLSYQELLKIGAKKKAVKSLLNVVVAESRLNENKKLIVDYEFVAKKSLEFGDPIVAGICFLNISREFQLIGSMQIALKYSNKSIDLLRSDLGTTHYFTSVLHRCHLYIELIRFNEAQLDYELVQSCPFPKIQEASKVVECLISNKARDINTNNLDPTWFGRWNELKNGTTFKSLSKLESKLLELLVENSKTKEELIELLYGDKISYSDSENRFKVLLSRFRKRHPGLLVLEDNKLKIADELFLKPTAI